MEVDRDFYKDGLKFACTRCSNCCRGQEGYVFLSKADLVNLTVTLQISEEELLTNYCKTVNMPGEVRISLIETDQLDCILWSKKVNGCIAYEGRPLQCKFYPFWQTMLNKDIWQQARNGCPGIDVGKLYSAKEIEWFVKEREKEPLINLKN
jgi:Fe-S-cluster containining protein